MVSLAVEDEKTDSEQDRNDEHHPHVPSPPGSLRDETAADRTYNWTEEYAHGIECYSLSTLRSNEQIRNDTSADCKTSAASKTGEKAHGDKTAKIGRQCTAECKGTEDDIADVEDDAAAVDFGEGREEERPDLICALSILLSSQVASGHQTVTT